MNIPTNTPEQKAVARSNIDDTMATVMTIQALTATGLTPIQIDGHTHVLVPSNYSLVELTAAIEKTQTSPNRKRGTTVCKDIDSLLQCCADQAKAEPGYIYADPDSRTITAVFNDQRSVHSGWRDHRATFKAEYTPEFDKWINRNGHSRAMGQTEFAEFIEDNMADIAEPTATDLLTVATTLQAKTDISFASSKRLDNGQVQLTYNEAINATAGSNGAMTIPREFVLGLRIFKNGPGYKIKARLKYRLGGGAVKFWYEMDRPERAVEDAFKGYIDTVREKSGYTVLLGDAGK